MSLIMIIVHTLLLLLKYHPLASVMLYPIKETISTMSPGLQWTDVEHFSDTHALSPIHSLLGKHSFNYVFPWNIFGVGCSLMYLAGFPFL